ncbi:hypothetical protein [Streptomyces sp. A1547]|uniref:hypothetical protein n=1 Tax=Streptomyces sp. A1547 TaxID=2563105 RepID=UPI00144AC913|nr:hypothetical protein [Streptomyces sp. A1547]
MDEESPLAHLRAVLQSANWDSAVSGAKAARVRAFDLGFSALDEFLSPMVVAAEGIE